MPNIIDSFLRLYKKNNFQTDEKINDFFSKHDLFKTFSSPEVFFDKIHLEVLKMFNEYEIFEEEIDLSPEFLSSKNWRKDSALFVVPNITDPENNGFKRGAMETYVRRGLIQIYLFFFGNRYFTNKVFRYTDMRNSYYLFNKNTNQLQKDRELVLQELLEKLLPKNIGDNVDFLIDRKKDFNQIATILQNSNHVMIIGPFGIGKSTLLRILHKKLHSNWNIFLIQFEDKVSFYHEGFLRNRILTEFNNRIYPNRNKPLLLLLDDIHFLPNNLLESLINTIIPEIKNIYRGNSVDLKLITTSALELDRHFPNSSDYFYSPYLLQEFSKIELNDLVQMYQGKISISLEDLYNETLGYPFFVNQVLEQGIIIQNADWYTLVIESLGWEPEIQNFMNAMCTFRFISPFFLLEFSKFIGDKNILKETWAISDQILNFSESKEYWNIILQMHSFISRISIDMKNFNKNKNFRISSILRTLVERHMKKNNLYLFEIRHRYASNYYKELLITQNASLKIKPFYFSEFIFHLTKLELSNEELLGNISSILQSIRKYSSKNDINTFLEVLGNKLMSDEELKEELNQSVIEQIINKIRTISGDLDE